MLLVPVSFTFCALPTPVWLTFTEGKNVPAAGVSPFWGVFGRLRYTNFFRPEELYVHTQGIAGPALRLARGRRLADRRLSGRLLKDGRSDEARRLSH